MSRFSEFVKEQLSRKEVAREYFRLSPFFRLADQLILLRKKRGLTQQQLAEIAGTTQAVVSRLENVSVHCSMETVVRLAEALEAVVEIKLIPSEEIDMSRYLTYQESFKDPSCEAKTDSTKGIVFFNWQVKNPCPNVVWQEYDPVTQQITCSRRKHKVAEIA